MKNPYLDGFRIVFVDDDKHEYGISDIIFNDNEINSRTCELQKSGRNVHVTSTLEKDMSKISVDGCKYNKDIK